VNAQNSKCHIFSLWELAQLFAWTKLRVGPAAAANRAAQIEKLTGTNRARSPLYHTINAHSALVPQGAASARQQVVSAARLFIFRALTHRSALAAAMEGGSEVIPVFLLDPHFTQSGRVGAARMTFLFDTLTDLHRNLQRLSSSLFCVQGSPEQLMPQLLKQWGITRLAYEFDGEPYARLRDQRISEIAAQCGVDVVVRCAPLPPLPSPPPSSPTCSAHNTRRSYGHTLFEPERLLEACGGKMPGSYGSLVKAVERLPLPAEIACPSAIKTPAKLWMAGLHSVPSLESLGLSRQETPFPGGESEGLARLQRFAARPPSPPPPPAKNSYYPRCPVTFVPPQIRRARVVDSTIRKTKDKSCEVYRGRRRHNSPRTVRWSASAAYLAAM
jgi:hypothetical protein